MEAAGYLNPYQNQCGKGQVNKKFKQTYHYREVSETPLGLTPARGNPFPLLLPPFSHTS